MGPNLDIRPAKPRLCPYLFLAITLRAGQSPPAKADGVSQARPASASHAGSSVLQSAGISPCKFARHVFKVLASRVSRRLHLPDHYIRLCLGAADVGGRGADATLTTAAQAAVGGTGDDVVAADNSVNKMHVSKSRGTGIRTPAKGRNSALAGAQRTSEMATTAATGAIGTEPTVGAATDEMPYVPQDVGGKPSLDSMSPPADADPSTLSSGVFATDPSPQFSAPAIIPTDSQPLEAAQMADATTLEAEHSWANAGATLKANHNEGNAPTVAAEAWESEESESVQRAVFDEHAIAHDPTSDSDKTPVMAVDESSTAYSDLLHGAEQLEGGELETHGIAVGAHSASGPMQMDASVEEMQAIHAQVRGVHVGLTLLPSLSRPFLEMSKGYYYRGVSCHTVHESSCSPYSPCMAFCRYSPSHPCTIMQRRRRRRSCLLQLRRNAIS